MNFLTQEHVCLDPNLYGLIKEQNKENDGKRSFHLFTVYCLLFTVG